MRRSDAATEGGCHPRIDHRATMGLAALYMLFHNVCVLTALLEPRITTCAQVNF